MSPYLAEFVGTMILIILGDGVVANVVLRQTKGHNSGWIVIAAGWGAAVIVAVYSVFSVSGAHLNPAVTIGLAVTSDFAWSQVPGYIIAQILGAFFGAVLVWLCYRPHFEATEGETEKLAVFSTVPAIRSIPDNFICEVIGTAVFVFGVRGILTPENMVAGTGFAEGMAPFLIGLVVFAIGLSLGGPTGYAINPARDLGPRIAHMILPISNKGSSDWGYAWVPIVGPIVGGVIGGMVFQVLYS
jgi:glycerol uptake facilitator protein